jgi:hypothetical protein
MAVFPLAAVGAALSARYITEGGMSMQRQGCTFYLSGMVCITLLAC